MSYPFHQGSGIYIEKKVKRLEKPYVVDNFKETVFQTQQGRCTYELAVIVMTCTRLAQAQDSQNPRMKEKGVMTISHL